MMNWRFYRHLQEVNMERYSKQTNLKEIGLTGQQKLKDAKVLVVGAGGLGCAVLPYLASGGIGTIGVIDGDKVEESNLPRQVLYSEEAVGNYKVKEAAARIHQSNSAVKIAVFDEFLTAKNALEIIADYDLIVDATDALPVRYLINDACVLKEKPFVYASVYKFEGQVSVFNYKGGPTYRCLFDDENQNVQNCEEAGVLGTTVGLIGMLQANEVMKIILGAGEVLSGKLLIYDMLNNSQHNFRFKKNENIKIDAEFFQRKHLSRFQQETGFREAVSEAKILLDVREAHEQPQLDLPNLVQLPLSKLAENAHRLNKDDEIRIFCQSGIRSLKALEILKNKGFSNLKSIKGGVNAFYKEIKNEEKEERVY
ncbi:HesA/MoeB/ThiF family protein [Zunongwangia sp. F363]|uniref:HesA/MoeB/ThiF family protein n=1 Tax=Autumnicola tepida TaxID=3075595 RepID=A0ABU3CB98_9FLAO|nr:HesA/MoeB/ThiF family protein [Zunongwangia sp. F363]MDT0643482.1 HesA/MoeB/ThiF family protein [Zunongwangia sp. F363]